MKKAQVLAFVTFGLTVVLVGVGVLVRATGSGLGCPDWPTCHGGVVPPGQYHAVIESSHRYVASLVGLFVIATAYMAWKQYRHVPVVFWTALITVPLVGIQGLLGALAVVRELPADVVATHLVTAMVVLGCELVVAIGMYTEDPSARPLVASHSERGTRQMGRWSIAALAWLAVLMWVGAYMAESGAATACEGWPLCNGSVLPAADDQEITHMAHRYLVAGFVVFIAGFAVAARGARGRVRYARELSTGAAALFVVQVVVGALNVWFTFPDALTMLHTVIASLVWSCFAAGAMMTLYRPARAPLPVALRAGEVPA